MLTRRGTVVAPSRGGVGAGLSLNGPPAGAGAGGAMCAWCGEAQGSVVAVPGSKPRGIGESLFFRYTTEGHLRSESNNAASRRPDAGGGLARRAHQLE